MNYDINQQPALTTAIHLPTDQLDPFYRYQHSLSPLIPLSLLALNRSLRTLTKPQTSVVLVGCFEERPKRLNQSD